MHSKRTSRMWAALLVLMSIVLVTSLAGAKTHLTMVTHWNTAIGQGALLQAFIDEYNAMQDEVEIELMSGSGYQTLDKIMVWAAGNQLPDILPVSQNDLPDVVAANIVRPMPADLAEQIAAEYMPGAIQLVSYKNELWGFPSENMPLAFTYDTVQFRNQGLVEFPQTWDDMLTVARKLTTYNDDGSIEMAGIGWSHNFREDNGLLMALTWAQGGDLFSDDLSTAQLTSPEAMTAMNFIADLTRESNVFLRGGTHGHDRQAIRIAPGPYVRSSILAQFGDTGPERLQEIHSALPPTFGDGPRYVPNYGWAVTVTSTTRYAEEAYDFVRWLALEPQADSGTTRLGDVMAAMGSIPNTRADATTQPLIEEPFMQGFMAPMISNEVRAWRTVSKHANGAIAHAVRDVINGTKTPVQAMNDAQTAVQRWLDEFK